MANQLGSTPISDHSYRIFKYLESLVGVRGKETNINQNIIQTQITEIQESEDESSDSMISMNYDTEQEIPLRINKTKSKNKPKNKYNIRKIIHRKLVDRNSKRQANHYNRINFGSTRERKFISTQQNFLNFSEQMPNNFGEYSKYLNEQLEKLEKCEYNSHSQEFSNLNTLVVFFDLIIREFNKMTICTEFGVITNLIGQISSNKIFRNNFNIILKKNKIAMIINHRTGAHKIQTLFTSGKKIIIAIILSFNDKNSKNSNNNNHTSVGIFRKTGQTEKEYWHFDPGREYNTYSPICQTMVKVVSQLSTKQETVNNIKRGFGTQQQDKSCFIRCLRYLAAILDGYDFINNQKFTTEYEMKISKFH